MNFYLTRDTEPRGGGYNLTPYLPKAPPNERDFPTWWFWDKGPHIILHRDDAQKLETHVGLKLNPGESLNLTTLELVRIEDAQRLGEDAKLP